MGERESEEKSMKVRYYPPYTQVESAALHTGRLIKINEKNGLVVE